MFFSLNPLSQLPPLSMLGQARLSFNYVPLRGMVCTTADTLAVLNLLSKPIIPPVNPPPPLWSWGWGVPLVHELFMNIGLGTDLIQFVL